MAYIYLIYLSAKNSLVYKTDVLLGILANCLSFYMYILLWSYLLKDASDAELQQMIAYQAIGVLLSGCYDPSVASCVGSRVMTGSIEMDLLKPYNYALNTLCDSIGRTLGTLAVKGLPYLAAACLTTGFYLQLQLKMIPLFLLVVVSSIFLYWIFFFIIGLLHFILTSAKWFTKITRDLLKFLGGNMIPIHYYPAPLRIAVGWLPFRLIYQFPQELLIGSVSPSDIVRNLCLLYLWIGIGMLSAYSLWTAARRILSIQGG